MTKKYFNFKSFENTNKTKKRHSVTTNQITEYFCYNRVVSIEQIPIRMYCVNVSNKQSTITTTTTTIAIVLVNLVWKHPFIVFRCALFQFETVLNVVDDRLCKIKTTIKQTKQAPNSNEIAEEIVCCVYHEIK